MFVKDMKGNCCKKRLPNIKDQKAKGVFMPSKTTIRAIISEQVSTIRLTIKARQGKTVFFVKRI